MQSETAGLIPTVGLDVASYDCELRARTVVIM